ncbi:MAG: hypothetical protein UR89_C0006G0016 [Candidatus Roizmanbacteria bacterium GW2011_GWA2_35_8]|uniref:Rod shape-determining protein MreD n=1 Tax=Candidatus Roizmanbacteria bacterium GW2011_GWA2_35_8 TaxID=1618479 RepID=A0A0G0FI43_9BACT|nr:MAG: hypothetical protein UR89_C0006G0016 [Candidatus Roizmanbacteria bacterium GW2011_GWA2_35_8]
MENRKILNRKLLANILIILLAVFARLIPHAPNFTPIGGLAIFSGSHFKSKLAILIPLLSMIVSDLFLGFHKTIPYVYLSFIAIYFLGRLIKNEITFNKTIIVSLSSSMLFFLVTNFGVWITGSIYQKSIFGLMQSYIMGLPFLRNTLISDLFYSLTFIYGYKYFFSVLKNKISRAKIK